MKTFVRSLRLVDFHVYGIGVTLFLLGLIVPWMFPLFVMYQVIAWKRMNALLMVVFIAIPFVLYGINEERLDIGYLNGEARVTNVETWTYSDRLTIRQGRLRYHVRQPVGAFVVGDVIYIRGNVQGYSKQTIPFGFDSERYYQGRGIDGYLEAEKIERIAHRASFWEARLFLKDKLTDHAYVHAYILGERSFENETDEAFRSLGISFLLTMSGLHVYALIDGLKYIFFRLDFSKHVQNMLIAVTLLFFLYVQAGSMSIVRIVFAFFLAWLNRKYDWRYTRLDRLFIVFYVMLVLNIDYIHHDGFIITFLILLSFSLFEKTYQSHGGYVQKLLLSTIVLCVTLPFYPRISFLVAFLMPLFIYLFTKPLFYGAILIAFIPEGAFVYDYVIDFVERLLLILDDRQVVLELPALNSLWTLFYYLFLSSVFVSRKVRIGLRRMFFVVAVFFVAVFQHRYVNEYAIYFLDVKQGDATVFIAPDCVALIDCFQYTGSFLKNLGIGKIDYVMLTHADQDHTREAMEIIDGFRVDRVILSPYETYEIDHERIERPRTKTSYSCGVFTFDVLGPLKNYDEGNDNSLIIQVQVYGKTYLFTGDAGIEVEADLIEVYGKRLKSDVLHVGHHGSNTSTSIEFLNHVDPEVAIISLGPNRYGFPHQSVLESLALENVRIMRTDESGTITYSRRKNLGKWVKHIPNSG